MTAWWPWACRRDGSLLGQVVPCLLCAGVIPGGWWDTQLCCPTTVPPLFPTAASPAGDAASSLQQTETCSSWYPNVLEMFLKLFL